MDKVETAKLITMVSALDRQPTDQGMVEMWHRILQEFDFSECEAAVVPAYKEAKGYVSARGIYAAVKQAREESARQRASLEIREDSGSWDVSACPVCPHGIAVVKCLPCCRRIYAEAGSMSADSRHHWAEKNLYNDTPF